ncbi:MAG: chemotaxis protein CheW [Spartobacteria bacterium]|nr:chemotaxis protein CheW [Spartobacteria bacterium]
MHVVGMRHRIKMVPLAYYHCMSRIVGREMLLGDREKEHMIALIRRIEGFTGVRVLTYAIMTNHVHLLLEEPDRNTVVSEDELRRRMAFLYSEDECEEIYERWDVWDIESSVRDKLRYTRRMHDISEFMKQLKQRFSRWYNKRNQRCGALWDRRFKSVLVEPGTPLRVVAAYIEMNPVRAGMENEPHFYRYCGFAEAMGGGQAARSGIRTITQSMDPSGNDWPSLSAHYLERILMYDEVRKHPERACTGHDFLREKLGKKLELTQFERLLCRCRYFTDGRIIGCKTFIEDFFQANRHLFGEKRVTGARKVKGGWDDLFAIRDLPDW